MSQWGRSEPQRWSPPSRGWRRTDWNDTNWPKEAARTGDKWKEDRSKRSYSECAPGPRDSQEAKESYAWKRCARSKGSASAEPTGTGLTASSSVYASSSSTGTPLDIRRRVEILSAGVRGLPGSLEAVGDFVAKAAAVQRENDGVPPPAPASEPRKA